ncbi:MAG: TetR/AcrR family transcriptional regulator [Betaproteobacteria bacterium]|nr:MAG: TetR/AcrR family transcriptional regulator [Betaproteobacteria bacterium]
MTPAQRLTDRKREAIVQAAVAEFRSHGFEATSMDKVAATAEVSKRTLYNHFASKEDLFAEILMQLWHRSASQVELAYRAEQPLREQLLALMLQKLAMLSHDDFIDLARVAIAATIHSPERAQDMLARLGEKESGVLAWIKAAQKDGRIKAGDAALAAQQLESLVKGAAFWPQVTMGQPKLAPKAQKQLAAAAVDLFLSHYAKA